MKALLQKAFIQNRSKLYFRTNYFLSGVTILSIVAISLETVAELAVYQTVFTVIEYFVVAVFTLEFCARLYAKEEKREYLLSFYGLVDIIAVLPTYLGLANLTFLKASRFVRLLQFLRMSRLAKLSRMNKYSNSNSRKAQEIRIISIRIYVITLAAAVMLFGTALYLIEGGSNELFKDIPSAVLWASMALLGGGVSSDTFSVAAKLLIVCLQFSSLLLFGLLIAIVGQWVERRLLGSSSIGD
jgi:voltage-gated potassium channel